MTRVDSGARCGKSIRLQEHTIARAYDFAPCHFRADDLFPDRSQPTATRTGPFDDTRAKFAGMTRGAVYDRRISSNVVIRQHNLDNRRKRRRNDHFLARLPCSRGKSDLFGPPQSAESAANGLPAMGARRRPNSELGSQKASSKALARSPNRITDEPHTANHASCGCLIRVN
jgi:hypothetical protein